MSGYGGGFNPTPYQRFGGPFGYQPMSNFYQPMGYNPIGSPFGFTGYSNQMSPFGMNFYQPPMMRPYQPFQMPSQFEAPEAMNVPPAPMIDPMDQPEVPRLIVDPIERPMAPQITAPPAVPQPPSNPFVPRQDDDHLAALQADMQYRMAPEGFMWRQQTPMTGVGLYGQPEYRLERTSNLSALEMQDLGDMFTKYRPAGANWTDRYNRGALAKFGRTKDARF